MKANQMIREVWIHGGDNVDIEDESDINPFHGDGRGDSSEKIVQFRRIIGTRDELDWPGRWRAPERNNRDDAKVEVPEFDGKAQGDAYLEWLITVERVFEFKDYSEEEKVKLACCNEA